MATADRHWIKLVTFCVIAGLVAALAAAIFLASVTVAFAVSNSMNGSEASSGGDVTISKAFSGMITDSFCGARHNKSLNKSSAECTKFCVRKGAKYVLVDGETSYELENNIPKVEKFAGQRAKIFGTVNGNLISVSSIGPVE